LALQEHRTNIENADVRQRYVFDLKKISKGFLQRHDPEIWLMVMFSGQCREIIGAPRHPVKST
jgi:hypothetical protein